MISRDKQAATLYFDNETYAIATVAEPSKLLRNLSMGSDVVRRARVQSVHGTMTIGFARPDQRLAVASSGHGCNSMKIDFQYFDDCPNWELTHTRLLPAVDHPHSEVEIAMVRVASPEEATLVGFRGSPSMVVGGLDLVSLEAASEGGNFSCRFYGTEDGAPTVAELQQAVSAMKARLGAAL